MTKRMLIDAAHAEETRVVVVDGQKIEELDFESQSHKQLRGNIYLAKVTRVEPSLQAAFIEYGGNRHGFLAFNEIHPDYYQIPIADREALMREELDDEDDPPEPVASGEDAVNVDDDDDVMEAEVERRRRRLMRRYKIQEVIKRRQIMLVQVVKEERGNKGAALTTYLSLAGRYCVLMPNTARGGGISRKITNAADRKRLKSAANALDVPQGMGLIIRTAGAARTKAEIKRDYEYLLRLWETIREATLKSIAPALIYEEEDLVKRAIRDMYDKDLDGILVEGEAGYREARDFMRMIMPSQAKKIIHYKDPVPLFVRHKIESQLAQIHSPSVPLRSGGYLVINQTEALVAVDVNSGRSTRERNIEATALKTNMEAAEETARQLRLRDLAGLVVIDFIDMEEAKNNRAVEKKLKDCLKDDRARVQMGKISPFGLMEISRQRRRISVLEGATHICEHCQGMGRLRSVESSALAALRAVEIEAARGGPGAITIRLPSAVALYVLNEKRAYLGRLEQSHGLAVLVAVDDLLARAEHAIERTASDESYRDLTQDGPPTLALSAPSADDADDDTEEEAAEDDDDDAAAARLHPQDAEAEGEAGRGGRGRRRRRGRGRREEGLETAPRSTEAEPEDSEDGEDDEEGETHAGPESAESRARRRRRRGRRGGRRVREDGPLDTYAWVHAQPRPAPLAEGEDPYVWREPGMPAPPPPAEAVAEAPQPQPDSRDRAEGRQRPGRGRSRGRSRRPEEPTVEAPAPVETAYVWTDPPTDLEPPAASTVAEPAPEMEPLPELAVAEPPKRRRVKRPAAAEASETAATEAPAAVEAAPPKPRRSRKKAEPVVVVAEETAPAAEAAPEPSAPAQVVEAAPPPVEAPAPAPPPPPEPDPNEILAPPAAPKRGWWRR